MDAPPLSSERKRELAELRSRAYGPDADIHLDANALARLRELEDMARADAPADIADAHPQDAAAAEAATPVVPNGSHVAADPADPAGASPSSAAPDSPNADETIADEPTARPRWWRRLPTWAFVAGAAAVGLAVGLVLPALMPPHPVATLRPAPLDSAELDFQMYGIQAVSPVRYEPFHDLEVWSAETRQGSMCIVVTTDTAEWMTAGCAPEPLKPSADITYYPGMRPIDGLELPDGSVVRFIMRDDVMEVWIAETTEGA
jgi:hypothetical protein